MENAIRVDVRVIAAANRDLEAAVANGKFREDLFYRLHVFPIEAPALRERKDDILMLVEYFVQRYANQAGKISGRSDKGVYATRPLRRRISLDSYYLGLDRKAATFNRGTAQENRETLGARLWRPPATKARDWDFDYEGVWQFGTFGPDDIRAWTVASDTGYSFPTAPLRPRISVKADVSSGDDPRHSSLGTFNPIYPRLEGCQPFGPAQRSIPDSL